jgi:hypothetical protein
VFVERKKKEKGNILVLRTDFRGSQNIRGPSTKGELIDVKL